MEEVDEGDAELLLGFLGGVSEEPRGGQTTKDGAKGKAPTDEKKPKARSRKADKSRHMSGGKTATEDTSQQGEGKGKRGREHEDGGAGGVEKDMERQSGGGAPPNPGDGTDPRGSRTQRKRSAVVRLEPDAPPPPVPKGPVKKKVSCSGRSTSGTACDSPDVTALPSMLCPWEDQTH